MSIPKEILDKEPARVRQMFDYWDKVMDKDVDFWPLEGDFDVHTKGHCERVLLLAMKMADMHGLTERQMTALAHASIFHDSRRKDNYMDTGHGDRAAEYYNEYSSEGNMTFLPEAYAAIKFHDRDDSLGEKYIAEQAHKYAHSKELPDYSGSEITTNWTEIYNFFKDADALDRLRLGPWALSKKYLRTVEAKGMVQYAQDIVNATIPPEEYKKIMDATRPFAKYF